MEQVEKLRPSLPALEELHLMGNMISSIMVMFYFLVLSPVLVQLLQVGYSMDMLVKRSLSRRYFEILCVQFVNCEHFLCSQHHPQRTKHLILCGF